MSKFIEIVDIDNNKYVINTECIVYIEEVNSDYAKCLIKVNRPMPICKMSQLTDGEDLYVKNSYHELCTILEAYN